MARITQDKIITSIDVGTTKICVLVGRVLDGQNVEIIGVGKAPSEGLKKGVVVDVAKTVYSIRTAFKEAELMAGLQLDSATIGISGAHIESINSHGIAPIKKGRITQHDIKEVLNAARAIPIREGQQILHTLPQYFIIDGKDRVLDPIGMHGIRLEVQAHIITGSIASVQNLVKCCQAAGINVNDIVLEQLASAEAVLSKDERELGVAVLDIGGGTSDLAVYQGGSIRHTMVLPIAGNHFTNDIAIGLRTTIKDAERIKREYAMTCDDAVICDDMIEVEEVQGKRTKRINLQKLIAIVEPRAQELLLLIHEEIVKKHLHSFMPTGLVITGGGSLLAGIDQLAHNMLDMPVRIGTPQVDFALPDSLHSPIYATGYGLLIHELKKKKNLAFKGGSSPFSKRVLDRMKSWVLDFF